MLVCDYGFEDEKDNSQVNNESSPWSSSRTSDRDTFRAFKDHQSWPPLKDPGEADLTADVDFGYLKGHLGDKALTFGAVSQREFLNKCGLGTRLSFTGKGERERKRGADLGGKHYDQ